MKVDPTGYDTSRKARTGNRGENIIVLYSSVSVMMMKPIKAVVKEMNILPNHLNRKRVL